MLKHLLVSTRKLLILSIIFTIPTSTSQLARISYGSNGFIVTNDGVTTPIPAYNIESPLRNLSPQQLHYMTDHGHITASPLSDGNYILRAHAKGLGGGPIAGRFMYWVTKSTIYGVAIAGAGKGAAAVAGKSAVAQTAVKIASCFSPASKGAMAASEIITAAGGATQAANISAATVQSVGCLAKTRFYIEAASTFVGGVFTAIPWLP